MAPPTEFTLEAIRNFMIEKGGKVTNHELVKHFKAFLTNPESRVEARTIFKEYVNTLASIKNEEGEKYLILKRKYRPYELLDAVGLASPSSMASNETAPTSPGHSSALTGTSLYHPMEVLDFTSPARQPPPYRPPPPPISPPKSSPLPAPNYPSNPCQTSVLSTLPEGSVVSQVQMSQEASESFKPVPNSEGSSEGSDMSIKENDPPPPVPPRRRSNDRGRLDNKENLPETLRKTSIEEQREDKKSERPNSEVDGEQKISVKERMQKFNRLASESDLLLLQPQAAKKKAADRGVVDEDRVSVTSLTPKSKEWIVRAAQGNYQMLAKLASEDSTLPWVKDPTSGYTALHWAAKHGNEDIVKLIAGTYHVDPNLRSNGGYTPLHIATQFGHENVFNLLVKCYDGDPQLRDWSGKMPRQYIVSQDTSVSSETIRSEYTAPPPPQPPPVPSEYSREGGKKRWLLVDKGRPRSVAPRPTSVADISSPSIRGQANRRASVVAGSAAVGSKANSKQLTKPASHCVVAVSTVGQKACGKQVTKPAGHKQMMAPK